MYYIESEKDIEVKLVRNETDIWLVVGGWNVFKLSSKGIGKLGYNIPSDNKEGLQVDESGTIILETYKRGEA